MAKTYNMVTSTVPDSVWLKQYKRYRIRRSRLYLCMASLMLFTVSAIICTVFLFQNSFFLQPSEYDLKNGDVRQLDVSTIFCQSVVVQKADTNRRITVMSAAQTKRYKRDQQTTYSDIVVQRRGRYWYRSFYLLKGSVVNMRLSSRHSISVYWLKGRKTLDKWARERRRASKKVLQQGTETFTGTVMSETFHIDDDDNYYLGFASIAGDTDYSEVVVNTSISRVVYDTSSCRKSCNASTGISCRLDLQFNSDDIALLEMCDNRTDTPNRDFWTVWYCHPRIWIYAAIFGGAIFLGNFVLFVIHICVVSKVTVGDHGTEAGKIPAQKGNLNRVAVKLRSSNNTRDTSYDAQEHTDEQPLSNITDGLLSNVSAIPVTAKANYNNFEEAETWGTPPRWSTFLREHPFDKEIEETVTNFNQTNHTPPVNNASSKVETTAPLQSFANELAQHLQQLENENFTYVGPEETDIDALDDVEGPDLETEPFIENNEDNEDHSIINNDIQHNDVVRRRESRRELRWQPRLSMVTEV